jgi:hypothetical protein
MYQRLFQQGLTSFIYTGICLLLLSSCANIIPPGGGPRDSIPPKLVMAVPKDSATGVTADRITLTFDEFVDIKQLNENLIVSPNPKTQPIVDYRLRNVYIRLRDSLQPNTTYAFNFGNAIVDVNEGNPAKGFTYAFTTGKVLDDNSFRGKVQLAETGKTDSTLIVVLHRNLNDTAIVKERPLYYTKINGKGEFTFRYLPSGRFNVFVLPNDYGKKYDDSTKMFAFLPEPVNILSTGTAPVNLYAFEEAKRKEKPKPAVNNEAEPVTRSNNPEKKPNPNIRAQANLENGAQDVLTSMQIMLNKKITTLDTNGIRLTDTLFKPITGFTLQLDSTKSSLWLKYPWKTDQQMIVLIAKEALKDSLGNTLAKTDTIRFRTKKESEYGAIKIRVTNLDLNRNPVLQFVQNDKLVESLPMRSKELVRKLYKPGEYELRILYDRNQNGIWDSGNYRTKQQPEIVVQLAKRLAVRPNWDNEVDLSLSNE